MLEQRLGMPCPRTETRNQWSGTAQCLEREQWIHRPSRPGQSCATACRRKVAPGTSVLESNWRRPLSRKTALLATYKQLGADSKHCLSEQLLREEPGDAVWVSNAGAEYRHTLQAAETLLKYCCSASLQTLNTAQCGCAKFGQTAKCAPEVPAPGLMRASLAARSG